MRQSGFLTTASLAAMLAMGAAAPALAQAAAEATALEELVVTARMRAESLQEVPVSVTAVTESQIEKLFVQDLSDLTRSAPNFTIEGVGAIHRNASVAYSRGIGYQGVDQAIDPSVGIAVDGVFYTRNIGALQSTFDIQQVELLRGPQGTLFGKNTTGGVVNITTKRPADHETFSGMVRVGNFGRADASIAADLPVSESLAFRLSATRQHSSGYMRNAYRTPTGLTPIEEHLAGDDIEAVRGAVRWEISEQLSLNASASYIKDRSDSVGGVNASFPTDALSRAGRPGFGFPGGPTDPFVSQRNFPSGDFSDTWAATNNLTYKGDGFQIVSISGIVRSSNFSYSDFDVTDLAFFETTASKRHKVMSTELRIESDGDGPLQWVAGGYAGRTKWDADQIFFLATQTYEASRQKEKTAAAFAQFDFDVTEQLTLTAGGRYSYVKKDFVRRLQRPIATFFTTPAVTDDATFDRFTYHLGANYEISSDAMLYASYSTGFKSGGFNSRAASAATLGPFKPEKAEAFEVGLKSDWLDNTLRINVAAFWNQYDALQISVFRPASIGSGEEQVVANNANERARGVEVEATWIPVEHLTLSASVGYLDAEYTSFVANLSGGMATAANPCGGLQDRSKRPCLLVPTRVPEITSRIDASYDFQLAGGGTITPNLAWSHEGSHFTDTLNAPQGYQKAYDIFDASITYVEPKGRWRASLWGKNLNDKAHRLSVVPTAGVLTQLYFAEPRTYGVELRVNLGE